MSVSESHTEVQESQNREFCLSQRRNIAKKLIQCLKYPGPKKNFADAYICKQDVDLIWARIRIRDVLYRASLTVQEIETIQAKLIRFLSILLFLKADEDLDRFRTLVFNDDGSTKFTDEDLPLEEDCIPQLEDVVLQHHFLHEQFLFFPEVIRDLSKPIDIDERRRLPFESCGSPVLNGAYGEVTKVKISAGYFNVGQGSTTKTFAEAQFVACKRFYAASALLPVDSKTELNNLEILKKSYMKIDHVRIHLAILFHRREQIILLPWAEHLDLHLFLLQGHDKLNPTTRYDFGQKFSQVKPGTFVSDVFKQLLNIASALKFLHEGVRVQDSHEVVYFAHMDLKPNNILIDADSDSTVGKWVLTDFGISAFRKSGTEPKNLVSIRQYVDKRQYLTLNTTAKRDAGAYQAPEIARHMSHSDSTLNVGTVGRMSDIWSFGCIFAEVLAFAVGQKEGVQAFREKRKKYNNDYFYEEDRSSATLALPDDHKNFKVREEVVAWLEDIQSKHSDCNNIVSCSVQAIMQILAIQTDNRPKAIQLELIMGHVVAHLLKPQDADACPVSKRTPQPHTSTPPVEHVSEPRGNSSSPPSITRTGTGDRNTTVLAASRSNVSVAISDRRGFGLQDHAGFPDGKQRVALQPSDDQIAASPAPNPAPIRLQNDPDRSGSGARGASADAHRTVSPSSDNRSTLSQRTFSSESATARRVSFLSRPEPHKISDESCTVSVPSADIHSVALCPFGTLVAVLTKASKNQQQHVKTFPLSLPNPTVMPQQTSIPLPQDVSWSSVAVCADTFAVWGTDPTRKKAIYIGKHREPPTKHTYKTEHDSNYGWLSRLETIRISREGCVVLVCHTYVYYISLSTAVRTAQLLFKAESKSSESIRDGAFSNNSTSFYIFSRSTRKDCVRVWRHRFDGDLPDPIATQDYDHERHGLPEASILPYNGADGCVISSGSKYFRSTLPYSSRQREIRTVIVKSDSKIMCMFGPYTLISVIKKGLMGSKLEIQESTIESDVSTRPTPELPSPGLKYPLSLSPASIVDMKVIDTGPDKFVLIIVTKDGKVVFVRVDKDS